MNFIGIRPCRFQSRALLLLLPAVLLGILSAPAAGGLPLPIPPQDYGFTVNNPTEQTSREITFAWQIPRNLARETGVLAFPVPPTTPFQTSRVIAVQGAAPKGEEILFDPLGTPFLTLQPMDKTVLVTVEVSPRAVSPAYPFTYRYDLQFSPAVAGEPEEIESTQELHSRIQDVLKQTDRRVLGKSPYHPEIQEFYPLPDSFYRQELLNRSAEIKEKTGGSLRLSRGLLAPEGADHAFLDSRAELIIPDRWIYLFHTDGRSLRNLPRRPPRLSGEYITLFYTGEASDRIPGPRLLPEDRYPEAPLSVQVTLAGSSPEAPRLFLPGKAAGDEPPDKLVPHPPVQRNSDNRVYTSQPREAAVGAVDLGLGYRSGQALDPGSLFRPNQSIYAVIKMAERGPPKNFDVRWIRPDGREYYTHRQKTGQNWGLFYTLINSKGNSLERGLWRIEVFVNGQLDFRRHFTVQ